MVHAEIRWTSEACNALLNNPLKRRPTRQSENALLPYRPPPTNPKKRKKEEIPPKKVQQNLPKGAVMIVGKLGDALQLDQPDNEKYVRELVTKANSRNWDITVVFCAIEMDTEEVETCVAEAQRIAEVMPVLQLILWSF